MNINKNSDCWHQGTYRLKNPKKYIGNKLPVFRSSWERRFMAYADNNVNVIRWGSEVVNLPYMYTVDGRKHTYVTDFYLEVKDINNNIKKYLVEIKPKRQTQPPKKPKIKNKKAIKRYIYETREYIKNKNKWKAAISFCKHNGIDFLILTEDTIFNLG